MYLAKSEIKTVKEMWDKWDEYYDMFGERFPPFNHDDWFPLDGKEAVDVWKDALLECLKTKTPFKSPYEKEKY